MECEEENLVFQAGPYAISSKTTPQKASSVSGTPVYEGNGIRVTLAGKSEGPFGDDLLLYVENNTDRDIHFTSYTDYDSPSYDFDAPMVIAEADVLAHKKAECHLAMMYTGFDYGKEWVITGNEIIETPFAAYDLKNQEELLFTTESVTIDTSKLPK